MPHRVPTHRPRGYSSQQEYERYARDAESKRFYHSAAWLKARLMQLREHPLCYECQARGLIVAATLVHHVIELTARPDLALDASNHRSLCHACHSRLHATRQGA